MTTEVSWLTQPPAVVHLYVVSLGWASATPDAWPLANRRPPSSAATMESLEEMGAMAMNWLDSASNGPCSSTEGNPSLIMQQHPDAHVVFSNIRWGDIGSTTGKAPGGGSSSSSSVSSSRMVTSTTTIKTSISTTTTTTTTTKPSTTTTTSAKPSSTSSASGPKQTHYGQCAGNGYTGPTVCASPYTCKYSNDWYSQCL